MTKILEKNTNISFDKATLYALPIVDILQFNREQCISAWRLLIGACQTYIFALNATRDCL